MSEGLGCRSKSASEKMKGAQQAAELLLPLRSSSMCQQTPSSCAARSCLGDPTKACVCVCTYNTRTPSEPCLSVSFLCGWHQWLCICLLGVGVPRAICTHASRYVGAVNGGSCLAPFPFWSLPNFPRFEFLESVLSAPAPRSFLERCIIQNNKIEVNKAGRETHVTPLAFIYAKALRNPYESLCCLEFI